MSAFRRADSSVGPVQIFVRLFVAFAVAILTLPVFMTSSAFAEGEDPPPPPSSEEQPPSEPAEEEPPAPEEPETEEPPAPEEPETEEPPATEEPETEEPAVEEPEAEEPELGGGSLKPSTKIDAGKGLAAGADVLAVLLVTDPIDCDAQTGTNLGTGKNDGFNQNTQEDSGGSWINGALNQNNSNYAEGDFVPQRVELSDIQPGLNQLTFTFDITKNSTYAYDYLDDLAIDEPGATISWDAPTTPPVGPPLGTITIEVTVVFDVPDATDGEMIISWAGHIASELDHGPGTSAGSISGAPYHFSLGLLNCASAGSQDNQLMADAVDFGTITIVKDAAPDDPQDFKFEIVPGGLASTFFLDDDADGTLSNTITFNVAPGVYDASEIEIPAGWDLVQINCVDAEGNSSQTSVPAATATITVVDDGTTTCTFVNGETSDLVVDKEWVVNGTTYDDGDVPDGYGAIDGSATLTLDGNNAVFGASNGGYLAGDQVAINETVDSTGWNPLCSPMSSAATEFNGATIDEALPYNATVVANDNHATITNVVECRSHWLLDKSVELLASPGDNDGIAEPGEHLEFTLTLTNDSGFPITGPFTVTDDLSDVLDNTLNNDLLQDAGELAALGLSLVGTELTWTVNGTIADGDSVSVSYSVEIGPGQWDEVLHNIATPGPGGECIPPPEDKECETVTETPPVTTLVIEKQDFETGEPLAGATFALYIDNAPDNVDSVGPEDELVGTDVTGACPGVECGLAKFGELQKGEYLVEETIAPPGYTLPAQTVIQVTIDDGNFVNDGEMTPIIFRDPTTGYLAIVAKQQFEFIDGEWVESDGVVDYGDFVKYVVAAEAKGPKNFYNVKLRDYLPGFNPVDTTSTLQATLVENSGACTGALTGCTVEVAPDGLLTFAVGDLFPGNGEILGGTVEFVIQFPDVPDNIEFVDGIHTDFLWNEGYLDYDTVVGGTLDDPKPVLSKAAKAALIFETTTLTSNEVVVSAEIEEEPIVPPPPPDLPDTGAQAHLGQLALLGGMLLTFGVALTARRRKAAEPA